MNPRIFMLGLGLAVGYVLGTRDGRERYDQMKAWVTGIWEDPRVAKARHDVEAYARQQAPIIRERAEAAAKAAPGVAKDAATKVAATAKDVAHTVGDTAKDLADRAGDTAKDLADRAGDTAKDLADRAGKLAGDLRERGEAAVDNAVATAGKARERVLDVIDDEDDAPKA
jgi:gas vesicle protein